MVSDTNTSKDNTASSKTPDQAETTESLEKQPVPEVIKFKSKFFSIVEGTHFIAGAKEGEHYMVTPLSEQTVELTLGGIKRELKLKDTSADGVMLDIVAKSLKFVQRIQIGDKVPSELTTGEASWEITDQHRDIAKKRLTMQLVTWLTGDEEVFSDMKQLEMVADDPLNKAKINDAFIGAARELGIPANESEKVIDLVNDFAEELAYIEALRGQFLRLLVIEKNVAKLNEIYMNDTSINETVSRVRSLSDIAFAAFREDFSMIDLHTKYIIDVLKHMPDKIKTVHKFRDEMYCRFWAWRELIEEWELTPPQRSPGIETLLQTTYTFLAQRFLPQDEWELFTKLHESTLKLGNEQVW